MSRAIEEQHVTAPFQEISVLAFPWSVETAPQRALTT
jgi:hypothetical protein